MRSSSKTTQKNSHTNLLGLNLKIIISVDLQFNTKTDIKTSLYSENGQFSA